MRFVPLLLAMLLAGCSTHRVDERIAYWKGEVAQLPAGATIQEAQTFFASRGLQLRCCMSSPPEIVKNYTATERNVGRQLWMQYNVVVLVDVAPDEHVRSVKVISMGVGL